VRAILVRTAAQRRPEGNKGTTIGFLGAKGGVGTTTLALNTGAALMLAGENPIVADFRLGAGSMGLSIGFGRSQGMANVLSKPAAEIRPKLIEGELAVHQSGLRTLLSSVRSKEAMTNFPLENLVSVVRALRTMSQPAIFDLGYGINPVLARLLREMDETIIVVEPTSVALIMARELIQEFETLQVAMERVHVVVVNRAQTSVQTPWQEIERLLGREIRAIISAAPELMFQAVQAGVPAVMAQPNAVVSNQMVKMSEDLNARIRTLTGDESKS
jgi:pilus assembly protein CpaE